MKIPKKAPDFFQLWNDMELGSEKFQQLISCISGPLVKNKYLHWDKLCYYTPPDGLSHDEWWLALKLNRRNLYKPVPFTDSKGKNFQYLITDPIPEHLHFIDQGAGGFIKMDDQITNPETRDQYYINSLIRESITSSQLEGAATTRKIAKEMIKTGRAPRDRSEQMILNNFRTMQRINEIKDKSLSKDLVFEIQNMVTRETLDDSSGSGRFRRQDEEIVVEDRYNEILHTPPHASQLEERMEAMCDFANDDSGKVFIHPVIRSIILHFWLAYDHPFIDGNGRTARALFYWSMLKHDYWLFEFISISEVILNSPSKYARAFLYTETDDNDISYFIFYHLDVIRKAISGLHDYIERKTTQLKELQGQLRGIEMLNHRQRSLIVHALRHPGYIYTIKSHQINHNVAYQTARTDMLSLCKSDLLSIRKIGKTQSFIPVPDLESKLSGLAD